MQMSAMVLEQHHRGVVGGSAVQLDGRDFTRNTVLALQLLPRVDVDFAMVECAH